MPVSKPLETRKPLWDQMRRLGWSNRIDDAGTISLMKCVKRNIVGRVIAREGGAAWERDVFLCRYR
jgi:hypothetical protein